MTSNIGSTQTIVTFLTETSPGTYEPQQRIFELEVSGFGVDRYTLAMEQFGQYMTDFLEAGNDAGRTSSAEILQFILGALDGWAGMIYVDEQGNQVSQGAYYSAETGQFFDEPYLDAGYNPTSDPAQATYYNIQGTMTRYMAEQVDQLIRTLRAAGWQMGASVENPPGTAAPWLLAVQTNLKLTTPDDRPIYDIDSIITAALSAAEHALIEEDEFSQSECLQQLLMVDYISRGNQLLFEEMSTLKDAININQNVLSYLNSLQDLMNQKDPEHFIMKLEFLSGGSDDEAAWQEFERETFNQELGTEARLPGVSEQDIIDYISIVSDQNYTHLGDVAEGSGTGSMAGAFVTLDPADVEQLTYIFDARVTTIITNLEKHKADLEIAAGQAGTPLANQLDKILNDFQALEGEEKLITWIQDYESGQEGEFQRHLNDAVVASQALNDTEREELRRVMFVYEEFYKSATAMLSRITQLIERMASSISR